MKIQTIYAHFFSLLLKNNGKKQGTTSWGKNNYTAYRTMSLIVLPSMKLTMSMSKGFKIQKSKSLEILPTNKDNSDQEKSFFSIHFPFYINGKQTNQSVKSTGFGTGYFSEASTQIITNSSFLNRSETQFPPFFT